MAGAAPACACVANFAGDPLSGCSPISCPALSAADATWPEATPLGVDAVVTGSCAFGYASAGTPTRVCLANGTWATTVTDPCLEVPCPTSAANSATGTAGFAESVPSADAVNGTCPFGFTPSGSGAPQRTCQLGGTWTAEVGSCVAVECPALFGNSTSGAAAYNVTAYDDAVGAVAPVAGECPLGWTGAPTRDCVVAVDDTAGTWGAETSPCAQLLCAAIADDGAGASWPEAAAGDAAVAGTCAAGWDGSPQRACNYDGVWEAPSSTCAQQGCDAENYTNAAWPAVLSGELPMMCATWMASRPPSWSSSARMT